MKKILSFIFLVAITLSLHSQQTELYYLSGTDKDHTVTWDFFCTHGMNSGKWSTIQVPSHWEQEGYGSYLYGQVNRIANEQGLYRYRFNVPEGWKNKKVNIVFEGSMTDTEVKINGKAAGSVHQGGFYRFSYDVSELLIFKGQNLLEVTVSKESSNESINRAERLADYWVFGGIYRPVYLEAFPVEHIERVAIDAKADGSFHMDVFLGNKQAKGGIEATILNQDGKVLGSPISAGYTSGTEKIAIHGSFKEPALWNPEQPNLYEVLVNLKKGNKIIHQVRQKFGFRTVEVKTADGIYVNGKKILFRGVCRHTFWPESGRASSKKLAIEDVNLMKDMNMNAVRMSHYPPDPYFLDVCDSLGLFVLDELGGWQKFYDTPTAKRLVKQLVTRDVNHPSVIIWDNGNEGGFNPDVRADYAIYDPQNRLVIEPWSKINGTDTKHYPKYEYVYNALKRGNLIYFPTEFLHGLFDGGHGAGLDDYWNLMLSEPLAAGGFLWVFADEGIERKDKNDSIDTHFDQAPDGILGPYHEKEGSYYTIREIWSPVFIDTFRITQDFTGEIPVSNRFLYTNLNQCRFTFELVRFENGFPKTTFLKKTGTLQSPSIEPGGNGVLRIDVPSDWQNNDVLYISAKDQYGRELNTWSWNITSPSTMASRIIEGDNKKSSFIENDSMVILSTSESVLSFSKKNGLIKEIFHKGKKLSLNNGPLFTGFNSTFREIKHHNSGNVHELELIYDSLCHARWILHQNGWLELQYEYQLKDSTNFSGITFSYPEELVSGAKVMANGPYHVWKNRLKGVLFDVYEKPYNNTVTGESWIYPEFKGYYSNFYAVEIQNTEVPFIMITSTEDLYLHLFTPQKPKYARGGVYPDFPEGDISLLNYISPIGTKFSQANEEGPQGQLNPPPDKSFKCTIYFKFGD